MVALVKIDRKQINSKDILHVADILKSGGIAIFPTETVYGMGVVFDDAQAIEKIYELKGRDKKKPFTLLISDTEMIKRFVSPIDKAAEKLMAAFWPGPLTIVLKKVSGETIGFRQPDHELTLFLLDTLGVPLATTSVNKSGQKEANCIEEIEDSIFQNVDIVVDSGNARIKNPSTVVFISDGNMSVLREGVISERELKEVLSNGN